MKVDYEKILNIISRAWGRKQSGYCFFPWIDREEQAAKGIRRAGYYEGPAFKWPGDRIKILTHMEQHEEHDLYWCPSLFEYESRRTEYACDERALWADLDSIDPRTFTDDEYPATIAWETSPDRYQALWLLSQGDIQGASWPGNENQRLTYYLGADLGGWDTTQLLRIPGWTNHKLEYHDKVSDTSPKGRLLWTNGRTYLQDDFTDLPEVRESGSPNDLTDAVIQEIEATDHNEVLARVRLKLTQRIRDFIRAREASGDRSNVLWEIERSLADAGCTLAEIVAIVKATAWNKYEGRADEFKRLILEANKALAQKPDEPKVTKDDILKEEAESAKPQRLSLLLANLRPPKWLVKDILTEGGLGFIAGEPKSFKSWVGLDLAISIASGSRFLNYFEVMRPAPVLYLQEEDSGQLIKGRYDAVARSKKQMQITLENGEVYVSAPQGVGDDIPIDATLQSGLTLSEGVWQEWLDEILLRGSSGEPYGLVLIDTMMMTAGTVEENRSQEMTTKFFKPLKTLARKHETALILVHHLNKNGEAKRIGQRMLGSVANHAWSEDAVYLTLRKDGISLQTESKSWEPSKYIVGGIASGKGWQPIVSKPGEQMETIATQLSTQPPAKQPWAHEDELIQAIAALGGQARGHDIATHLNIAWSSNTRRALNNRLTHRATQGKIHKLKSGNDILWCLPPS